jgi:hypothetical protein
MGIRDFVRMMAVDLRRVTNGGSHYGLVQGLIIDSPTHFGPTYSLCFQEAEMVWRWI